VDDGWIGSAGNEWDAPLLSSVEWGVRSEERGERTAGQDRDTHTKTGIGGGRAFSLWKARKARASPRL